LISKPHFLSLPRLAHVKLRINIACFLAPLLILAHSGAAQIVGELEDESKLYAESKQVNQFFRRFNGEEDEKGRRYYQGNKQYHSEKLRKKYLSILFDESNAGLTVPLKAEFAKMLLDHPDSTLLDFHSPGWYSEVLARFSINGKSEPIVLFMELEKDHLGWKWVIRSVHVLSLEHYFVRDTTKVGRFLHPMSHELEFMNLRKALVNTDSLLQFTSKRYVPDHLSLFLYELKRGTMKFESVENVKFHFFQINGWYFELSDFNRPGYNTGWLISSLVRLKTPADLTLMRNHLFHETP
jgi:hypothetical protein